MIPSLAMALISAGAVLLSYSIYFNHKNILTGIIISISAILSVPFIYKNSIKNPSDKPLLNLTRLAILIIICGTFSCFIFLKIRSMSDSDISTIPADNIKCKVESFTMGRYNHEIILSSKIKDSNVLIAAYTDDIHLLSADDEIILKSNPKYIGKGKKDRTDFENSLYIRGITFTARIRDGGIEIIKKPGDNFRQKTLLKIYSIMDEVFDKRTSSFLKALYFGNKNYADRETIDDFRKAGILHILAASGFNVAIIAAVPLFLLSAARARKSASLAVALVAVCFYFYLSEMPVSLLRACIMFGLFTLQFSFGFDKNILNILFLSASGLILLYPHEIFNLGFQLTYTSTLGIILFYNSYRDSLSGFPEYLKNSAAITLSAQVFVLPIILFQMGQINLAGIVTNLFAIPLVSLMIYSSLTGIFIHNISPWVSGYIGLATDFIFMLNNILISFMADRNWHFFLKSFNPLLVFSFILTLIPLIPIYKIRYAAPAAIISGFYMMFAFSGGLSSGELKNNFIFQKDGNYAALISGPAGYTLTGNIENIEFSKQISSWINEKNINRIDLLLPSADYKNLNSYTYISKKVLISKCYISSDFKFSKSFENFLKIIDSDKINLETVNFKNPPDNIKNILDNFLKLTGENNESIVKNKIITF